MVYDPEEDWSAASWLAAYANTLENNFLDYWEFQNAPADSQLSSEDRRMYQAMLEIARGIIATLHSLRTNPGLLPPVEKFLNRFTHEMQVSEDTVGRVVRAIHSHPIIRDCVRIDLAQIATDWMLENAEKRAGELLALVAERQLSERSAAFLDRATRLYLWGFDPEAVVMCAAVLEAAYEERFSAADMIRLQVPMKGNQFTAAEYERAAGASGVFSKRGRDSAARIRVARNDILHNVPDSAIDSLTTIKETAQLLELLFPRAGTT